MSRVERVPPNNIEAERAVIGSALLSRDALTELAGTLRPEDFYHEGHRRIWETMLSLRDEGSPADLVTVTEALRSRGALEIAGGVGYVAGLGVAVPTAAAGAHYAQIVRDMSVRRALIAAGTAIVGLAFDATQPTAEVANEAERRVREATLGAANASRLQELGRVAYRRWEHLQATKAQKGVIGLPTGFRNLDGVLGGLMPGDLNVLAARPSLGKTSLALGIIARVARRGVPVLLFSLEMSAEQIADRLVCAGAKLDSLAVRTRTLSEDEWDRAAVEISLIGGWPALIDDRPALTSLEIWSTARRVKGLGLVVIDYLGLIGDKPAEGETKAQFLEGAVNRLKVMARDLDVPVLCLCQLNREIERRGGEPQLSDIRDSGGIEQTADVVLMLYRDPEEENVVRCKVAKNRNGPTGEAELFFERKYARFLDLERRRQP